MNIPLSTITTIIKKLKEYGTTTNLTREGLPLKLMDQARRALIREATKTHTTSIRTLHRAGLYGRVARKKQFLKEKNKQTCLVFAKRHERRYSG